MSFDIQNQEYMNVSSKMIMNNFGFLNQFFKQATFWEEYIENSLIFFDKRYYYSLPLHKTSMHKYTNFPGNQFFSDPIEMNRIGSYPSYFEEHCEKILDFDGSFHVIERRRLGDSWCEEETIENDDGRVSTKVTWHNVSEDQIDEFMKDWKEEKRKKLEYQKQISRFNSRIQKKFSKKYSHDPTINVHVDQQDKSTNEQNQSVSTNETCQEQDLNLPVKVTYNIEKQPENTSLKDKSNTKEGHLRKMTAYNFFVKEKRGEVVKENPTLQSKEVFKIVADMWKDVPEEERQKYKEKAESFPYEER